jgi:hypothetical protein
MRTKFYNVQKDDRKHLRAIGWANLLKTSKRIDRRDYDNLEVMDKRYILPDPPDRGFVLYRMNNKEAIRFYISPGNGAWIADKIEYHYTDVMENSTVSFDITREPWAQDIFKHLEEREEVADFVDSAQE